MARQDLGKIVSEITNVNVTVDNNVGVPSAEASISGTLTEKELSINFKNLKGEKGDKPIKGTDYFTEEEKQQFTTETVGLVTAEGEKQITAIGEKGTAETQKVTAEGTKQTNSVKNQGTTSLNAVKKVQTDIEALLNNQTASGNALSLNGKTGVQYDKEIQGVAGGYSGNFPLTTADLNGIYLLPSTGKFYVCIKAYNGTQISAPNANFEELSVYKNRDRLENLSEIYEYPGFILIGDYPNQTVTVDIPDIDLYDFVSFAIQQNIAMNPRYYQTKTFFITTDIKNLCDTINVIGSPNKINFEISFSSKNKLKFLVDNPFSGSPEFGIGYLKLLRKKVR